MCAFSIKMLLRCIYYSISKFKNQYPKGEITMKLRDKMWLWGHPEGRYNHEYGNEKESRMTPMEGCLYLGVKNTFK